jgi:hypothetical protein
MRGAAQAVKTIGVAAKKNGLRPEGCNPLISLI